MHALLYRTLRNHFPINFYVTKLGEGKKLRIGTGIQRGNVNQGTIAGVSGPFSKEETRKNMQFVLGKEGPLSDHLTGFLAGTGKEQHRMHISVFSFPYFCLSFI